MGDIILALVTFYLYIGPVLIVLVTAYMSYHIYKRYKEKMLFLQEDGEKPKN